MTKQDIKNETSTFINYHAKYTGDCINCRYYDLCMKIQKQEKKKIDKEKGNIKRRNNEGNKVKPQ